MIVKRFELICHDTAGNFQILQGDMEVIARRMVCDRTKKNKSCSLVEKIMTDHQSGAMASLLMTCLRGEIDPNEILPFGDIVHHASLP